MNLSPEQREDLRTVLCDVRSVLTNGRLSLADTLQKMTALEQLVKDVEEMIQPTKEPE